MVDIPQYPNYPAPPPGGAVVVQNDYREPVPYRGGNPYPQYGEFDTLIEKDGGIDLYRYLRIAAKHKWLVFSIMLTAVAIAVFVTYLMTPIFRATSSIQIDRESVNVVKLDDFQADERMSGTEFYQTQYELLGSRTMAERVVTTMGIAENPEFLAQTTSLIGLIKSFLPIGTDGDKPEEISSQDDKVKIASRRLLGSLTVAPVRGSRIVKINIDHPDPAMAQSLANTYAEVFISENLDRRFDATSYAKKFLEERLAQLKAKLGDSEKELVKYAEDQGIISLDGNKNLSATDLEAINIKLNETRGERLKKEQLWKQAQQTQGTGLKEILDNENIQANQKLRAELAAEYQQKLAVYKPAFPLMAQLRNQIKELDRQIVSEIAAIKRSIEAQYIAVKEEEDQLLAQLENSKADVTDQRNRSIQYNILQREVDTNRTLYDGLLQRYKEIGVAGGVGTNNITIVDKALLPTSPRSPSLFLNLALAIFGGLLLGVLLALLLDYIDDTFKAPDDIEREIGLPVIGVIPKPRPGSELADEMLDARSGMSEAYRSLRTSLQFSTSEGLPRTLLITSSKPSEGKTTTTIALAQSLAQLRLNVLLIDCDLRNASIHRRLGVNNEFGLSNYLAGSHAPEDVVQVSDTERLVLITSGPLPPNPAELLSGPRLSSLLAVAQQSFDVVLLDGPPVMGLADAPILSAFANATMLVIAANETRKSTVKVALKRLMKPRANVIGALLNKFNAREAGYGYGYGYGYQDYDYHSYGSTLQLPGKGG
jgi:polysaccharide biosynthesis transport protein